MIKINCLIVEDEVPSAEELNYILSKFPILNIVGIVNNGEEALKLIVSKDLDVIFLDINMPVMNGMELAQKVRVLNQNIKIIFVTAYESHALKAFELEATDYVLKPFDEKRIDVCIKRLIDIFTKSNEVCPKSNKIPAIQYGRTLLIDVKSICYCFSQNEKTFIKTKDKTYDTTYALYQIEEKTGFFRAHKSFIVNIDHIKELYSWTNGTYMLIMDDTNKSEITVSRTYVNKLKNIIGL